MFFSENIYTLNKYLKIFLLSRHVFRIRNEPDSFPTPEGNTVTPEKIHSENWV